MASTIRDVAARAGLSVGTVSKYINGKTVKESTRLAIEEAIKELDFHPNNTAKELRNAKKRIAGTNGVLNHFHICPPCFS